MPVDNLHSINSRPQYIDDRNRLMELKENPYLFNLGTNGRIHGPGGLPTIGYGYDLTRHPITEIIAYLTHALGGHQPLTADQIDGLNIIRQWKAPNIVTSNADLIGKVRCTVGTPQQR